MKREINKDSLRNSEKLGKELEKCIKNIKKQLQNIPLNVVHEVDSFEVEREKIDEIINFYHKIMEVNEIFEKQMKFLESNFISTENYQLVFIKKSNFLNSLILLIEKRNEIRFYDEINMVNELIDKISPVIHKYIETIRRSFFYSLDNHLPEFEEYSDEVSLFLQKNIGKKKFIEEYTKLICEKFKFGNIYRKKGEQIDKIAYFDVLADKIKNTNSFLLHPEDVNPINQTILKFLIADGKSSISDTLLKLEKRQKIEDVVFLMGLISIFHQKKNYVEFTDLKEECFKMINNLLVNLLSEIGLAAKPNKFCETEKFIKHSKVIVNTFDKNEDLTCEILKKVETIRSNNNSELKEELGKKCFTKVVNLSDTLEGMNKRIYLLNNYDSIKELIEKFGKNDLHELVLENKDEIINIWRNELKKRERRDVTEFIDSNLQVLKKYTLPGFLRNDIINAFKESIFEIIKNSSYRNRTDKIEKELDEAFMGR